MERQIQLIHLTHCVKLLGMATNGKRPPLVGGFIRQHREAIGLSQRALGLLFDPPVTTQFISNMERGVTPLPPAHVPTLTKALKINTPELLTLLEREFTAKLSKRLGQSESEQAPQPGPNPTSMPIASDDYAFMRKLYDAYRQADPSARQAFATVCESILSLPKNKQPG
jgi:transcriptional regulator with XRE-family HTH domain